jgi:hypothetical protein
MCALGDPCSTKRPVDGHRQLQPHVTRFAGHGSYWFQQVGDLAQLDAGLEVSRSRPDEPPFWSTSFSWQPRAGLNAFEIDQVAESGPGRYAWSCDCALHPSGALTSVDPLERSCLTSGVHSAREDEAWPAAWDFVRATPGPGFCGWWCCA